MAIENGGPSKEMLTTRPIPDLIPAQLDKFTDESLQAREVKLFSSAETLEVLKRREGHEARGVDIGGNKLEVIHYQVHNGDIKSARPTSLSIKSPGGQIYLGLLKSLGSEVPTGISFAGPVEGTRPIEGPNLKQFMEEFEAEYEGDFTQLFPQGVVVENDAEAGLMASGVELESQGKRTKNILYIINGSGVGGAVLSNDQIITIEPGHIEIVPELNPMKQDVPCRLNPQFTCIEAVAGGRAGIEDLWKKSDGREFKGETISRLYLQGNELATQLYDNSAVAAAHSAVGVGRTFGLLENPEDITIVYHGGVFKVSGYTERVQQILEKNLGFAPNYLLTSSFADNACAQGAAIAALTAA